METEYDYLFKIVLIGDAGVGKTSIVRRYTDGIFTSAGIPTIGVDFCIKTLQIGSSAVKVSVYVTTHLNTLTYVWAPLKVCLGIHTYTKLYFPTELYTLVAVLSVL